MPRREGKEAIYHAAEIFLKKCLTGQGSLVWPGASPWNHEALQSLWTNFYEKPDEGERGFFEKLRNQLASASSDASKVAVDILAFYYLYPDKINAATKIGKLREVAAWSKQSQEIDLRFVEAAYSVRGIGNPGTYYNTGIPWNFAFLVSLGIEALGKPDFRIDAASLEEETQPAMARIPGSTTLMRNATLHLIAPDSFERIGTARHKELVLKAFSRFDSGQGSVDARLRGVRAKLAVELGRPTFDFYDSDIAVQWKPATAPDEEDPVEEQHFKHVWIEKTHVAGRVDRESGEHALGAALWSPQRSKSGADIYRSMREVREGDLVLHLTDNEGFTGVSKAAGTADDTFFGVNGTDWSGVASYRVPLRQFRRLDPPLSRDVFFASPYKEQLVEFADSGGSNLFYNAAPSLNQGAYLTAAPPRLLAILSAAYRSVSGKELLEELPSTLAYIPEEPRQELDDAASLAEVVTSFSAALRATGISYGTRHEGLVRSFVASLATKGFVILTGLSGSGKTQLAIRFGEWIGADRMLVVPVRPDWTGAEALFGYEDALQSVVEGRRAWQVPDALRFMLSAARDPGQPYLLVLDEMNLAHVERYFADVLSGMESSQACLPNLSRERGGDWRISAASAERIPMPKNLFIVGTVNVDETTYMFSPKVLDRANTFEFRVHTNDLLDDNSARRTCPPGPASLVRQLLAVAKDDAWHVKHPAPEQDQFAVHLRMLHAKLSAFGFEFGHRTFREAARFAALLNAAGDPGAMQALDRQVMQKILPRVHGARRRIEPVLVALGAFCFDPTIVTLSVDASQVEPFDPCAPTEAAPRLPLSFDKIRRMTELLRVNQFVSFTE